MQRRWSRVFAGKTPQPVALPIHAVSGDVGVDLSKSRAFDDLSTRLDYDEFPNSIQSSPLTQLFERFDSAQGGIANYQTKTSRTTVLKQLLVDLRKKLDDYEDELKQFETNLYQQQEFLTQKTKFLNNFQDNLNSQETNADNICQILLNKQKNHHFQVLTHSEKVGARFLKTFNDKIKPCQFGLKNLNYYIKSSIDDDEEFENEEIRPNEAILKMLHPQEYQEYLKVLEDVHEIYISLNKLV